MYLQIFKSLIKIIHLIPISILKNFFLIKDKNIENIQFQSFISYHITYVYRNSIQFFLNLFFDIFKILINLQKSLEKNNVISIISTLIFYNEDNMESYTHSLSKSNKLYVTNNLNEWLINLLLNIIEKLETYKLFKRISLIINIKKIENL